MSAIVNSWNVARVGVVRRDAVEKFGKQIVALCALAAEHGVSVRDNGDFWVVDGIDWDAPVGDLSFIQTGDDTMQVYVAKPNTYIVPASALDADDDFAGDDCDDDEHPLGAATLAKLRSAKLFD